MEKDLLRFAVGIYTDYIVMIKEPCPNFDVCHKQMYAGLKVCSLCFWKFENQILDFKDDVECLLCLNIKKCVKFRKCPHYACLTCFPKYHKCPICFMLKEADTQVNNE
jgi:hypothetical protein